MEEGGLIEIENLSGTFLESTETSARVLLLRLYTKEAGRFYSKYKR